MEILCEFEYLKYEGSNGFRISEFKPVEPCILPDGKTVSRFTAKGYALPDNKDIECILSGNFEKYKGKDGNTSFTFAVSGVEEVLPTEEEKVEKYLITLPGIGKGTAKKLISKFGMMVFDVLENDCQRLSEIKGISKNKAEKIGVAYAKRKSFRKLFQFLLAYHIGEAKIMKLSKVLGEYALELITDNPYIVMEVKGIGFKTAEAIAKDLNVPKNDKRRIEAGIMEVLMQAEIGGDLMRKGSYFPGFVYNAFLRKEVFELLDKEEELYMNGTYLPKNILYLLTLKLLNIPLQEWEFDKILLDLHLRKQIFLSDTKTKDIKISRYATARAEHRLAKALLGLKRTIKVKNLDKVVFNCTKEQGIRLSDEQESAVKNALSNGVSVITGGPGTGKTAIQKILLASYEKLKRNPDVLLVAPTGMAARRMSESTGYPARTIHSALGLRTDDEDDTPSFIDADIIILDEASMVGTFLFEKFASSIKETAILVIVGDVDQLPSIEIGTCLKDIIESGVIPVTRLTKTFRQAKGSSIITNAARIRVKETILEYADDFSFLVENTSEKIAERVVEEYLKEINKYSLEQVCCLSPFRRFTEDCTDKLNEKLRNALRGNLEGVSYFKKGETRIYNSDRVMYTKNNNGLTNGDIGTVVKIRKNEDGLSVSVNFNGEIVELEDDDCLNLELAYAITVHKSQGSEYKTVIMACDPAHKILLKNNLVYTGITRASETVKLIGSEEALYDAILEEQANRRTLLASIIAR